MERLTGANSGLIHIIEAVDPELGYGVNQNTYAPRGKHARQAMSERVYV